MLSGWFQRPAVLLLLSLLLWSNFSHVSLGDEFTYVDDDGKTITSQGRLLESPEGIATIERWDGQIVVIPQATITEHKKTGDATPITCEQMGERLKELFKENPVRIEIQDNMVVALVLAAPPQPRYETAVKAFGKKAVKFMQNVEGTFEKYAKQMDFPLRDSPYPMVLIIFESEEDFNDYYKSTIKNGDGLSASGVLGFYSGITNWLAVRMSSCDSFAVPLHEAIHQQMANRVHQRLAPIPRWFAEGIANSFEGNGDRIDTNPAKINNEYVRKAQSIQVGTSWSSMMGNDNSFLEDVLAGDAYTLAWCLHWTAWTQFKDGYKTYVQELSRRTPLEQLPPQADDVLFQKSFGMTLDEMQAKFPAAIFAAAKRQKIDVTQIKRDPIEQKALCQFKINVASFVDDPGNLRISGTARSICPFRDMTFYLTVETEGGFYYEYLLTDMKPRVEVRLTENRVRKQIPGESPSNSSRYRVFVRSVPSDSPEALAWKQGQVPGPFTAQ